jgi:hypothetical protein
MSVSSWLPLVRAEIMRSSTPVSHAQGSIPLSFALATKLATMAQGFDCYWTTSTFKLVHRERRGTTWQVEADLGGTVQQRPACLARNDGARIDCLVRGRDNTLQQRSYY